MSAHEQHALMPGDWLGPHFEIQALIGEGAMGEVYLATQHPAGRPVAIKRLRGHTQGQSAARFEREAAVLSALDHPAIVTLHECGWHDGAYYIAMEYVIGDSLAHRLDRGPMALREVVRVVVQLANALGEAHRRGIVHRDLKPANVLLLDGTDHEVKIVDFGLAKLDAGKRSSLVMAGTPHYMPPEQAFGGVLDGRTDLYALGCCAWEMLAGAPPFLGSDGVALVKAHRDSPRPTLPQPGLRRLSNFLARAMAPSPEGRPDDAVMFVEEFVTAASKPGAFAARSTRGRMRVEIPAVPARGPISGDQRAVLESDDVQAFLAERSFPGEEVE